MRINRLTIGAPTPRHTDMRGTIAFVLATLLIVQSLHAQQPAVTVTRTVSFPKPGVYQLTLRATSQRNGVSDF